MSDAKLLAEYVRDNCGRADLFKPEILRRQADKMDRYSKQGGVKQEYYRAEAVRISRLADLLEI